MKDQRVTIRFTKEEYDRLKTQQSLEGYMSTAKYIRHKIFSISKTAPVSSINSYKITKDIGELTAQVKKIGVNYNQVVKRLNSMPGAVKSAEMIRTMLMLQDLTKAVLIQVRQVKEEIIANGNKNS
jgi:hypothetical protein